MRSCSSRSGAETSSQPTTVSGRVQLATTAAWRHERTVTQRTATTARTAKVATMGAWAVSTILDRFSVDHAAAVAAVR